jgi:hypothetical protein
MAAIRAAANIRPPKSDYASAIGAVFDDPNSYVVPSQSSGGRSVLTTSPSSTNAITNAAMAAAAAAPIDPWDQLQKQLGNDAHSPVLTN